MPHTHTHVYGPCVCVCVCVRARNAYKKCKLNHNAKMLIGLEFRVNNKIKEM